MKLNSRILLLMAGSQFAIAQYVQQGDKLVGTVTGIQVMGQGNSVAISGDGNRPSSEVQQTVEALHGSSPGPTACGRSRTS